MEAQKENAYLKAGGSASQDKLSTPQRGFVVHKDSAESTGKKSFKERSFDKKRRVLGDISNKQRDCHRSNNSDAIASTKKVGPGDGLEQTKTRSIKQKTPLKTKAVALLEPTTGIKPPRVDEEVPDVEFAYGGLSSPKSDSAYMKGLHDEIIQDILNGEETPTLFDDFDPASVVDDWADEKAMLENGEPPSPWWNKESEETDLQEEVEEQYPVLDDVPPPDDFSNASLSSLDADELLEDLLSVDVEAVCTE